MSRCCVLCLIAACPTKWRRWCNRSTRSSNAWARPSTASASLLPLLRLVLAGSAPLAQARGSTLALQVDDQAEAATVRGDAAALAVLARNLIDNALRYTPARGQVKASLALRPGHVLLQVDDNGPG